MELGIVKTMAKKKTPPRIGRPPSEEGPRKQILTLRGRDAYKEWLIRYAEFKRSDMADLVDYALASCAKRDGFETPPRR